MLSIQCKPMSVDSVPLKDEVPHEQKTVGKGCSQIPGDIAGQSRSLI